jgi:ubiquinone/menaquinone biosynthesis C-methylase UbiE
MVVERVPLAIEPIEGAVIVEEYDRYAAIFLRPEYRLTVKKILRRGIKSGRVLDIGTGSGRLIFELAKVKNSHFDIVGLDVSFGMLKLACINTIEANLPGNVNYVQANAARLPFPDETFDVVMSYASLHHWQRPGEVFDEIWRVTNKNGMMLIRDNHRILGNPFYKTGIWFLSILMKKQQRGMWPRAILASYTLSEIEALLDKSKMSHFKVSSDMWGFDSCVESQKRN